MAKTQEIVTKRRDEWIDEWCVLTCLIGSKRPAAGGPVVGARVFGRVCVCMRGSRGLWRGESVR
jgi:hypothetical protein